jgi:hypothetical protein
LAQRIADLGLRIADFKPSRPPGTRGHRVAELNDYRFRKKGNPWVELFEDRMNFRYSRRKAAVDPLGAVPGRVVSSLRREEMYE